MRGLMSVYFLKDFIKLQLAVLNGYSMNTIEQKTGRMDRETI
jgi:hypothetical protein